MNRARKKVYVRDALTNAEGKLRTRGGAPRIAWMILGIVAAAATGAVVVWQVLDQTDDQESEPEKESGAQHL